MGAFSASNLKVKLPFPLKLIVLFYAVSPFLYLLRAVAGDQGVVAIILRSLQPVLIIVFVGAILKLNKQKIPWYCVTLLFIGMYGAIAGTAHGNKLFDIFSGLSHFLTGILILTYIYLKKPTQFLDEFMRQLTIFSITSISIVVTIMHVLPSVVGINIYLGLACQVLLVVFFYNFQQKKLLLCLFTLVLIAASGKRGVLVALIIGIAISFFPFFIRHHIKTTGKIFVAGLIGGVLLISTTPALLDELSEKFVYDDSKSINDYSSGRMVEASSAIEYWTSDVTKIIAGAGMGFTYTYKNQTQDVLDVEDYKNVHFSYLNPLIIFGIPVAVLYFSTLLIILFKVFSHERKDLAYLRWSTISFFVYACFVFNLFNEPILWASLGFILNDSRVKNKRENFAIN